MSSFIPLKKRHPVPRWRFSRRAQSTGELVPISGKISDDSLKISDTERGSILALLDDFTRSPYPMIAADLFNTAYIIGDLEGLKISSDYIISNASKFSQRLVELAQENDGSLRNHEIPELDDGKQFIDNENSQFKITKEMIGSQIRDARARLAILPDNAVALVDLAHGYAASGRKQDAERAVFAALRLGENRFVLRAAARMYLHFNDPQRALYLLRRSSLVHVDPWVLAAEVAIATDLEIEPPHLSLARKMLRSDSLPPFHLSELAAGVGSFDFLVGNHARQGRRAIRLSLREPTENALAQARFLAERRFIDPEELVPSINSQPPHSNEFAGFYNYQVEKFEESLLSFRAWLRDEPFSSRPTGYIAFLSHTLTGDAREATIVTQHGLRVNPDNFTLKNNLVYYLLQSGKTAQARQEFEKIDTSMTNKDNSVDSGKEDVESNKIILKATHGLLQFKEGESLYGEQLYQDAILNAAQSGRLALQTMALIHLAEQQFLVGNLEAEKTLSKARDLLNQGKDRTIDSSLALKRVEKIILSK